MHNFLSTTHRSVVWFKNASDAENLEMSPPFQRNPVWSRKQQSSLIDTILLGYPIPELYMQDITDDKGNQKYIIVDGQQRIRAILYFLANEFELEDESPHWAGMTFEDLSTEDRKRFWAYNFVVRLLPEISYDEITNIFQRLNKNTTILNQQELRHATYWGPFIKLMEEISDNEFWSEAHIFSANDLRRMLDVEFISELAVAYLNGIQNKKKKLEEYYQQYDESFDEESEMRTMFSNVLGELNQVIPNLAKTRWRKKSDFYSLFLVFAKNYKKFPLPAEKRLILGQTLSQFGKEVDWTINETIPEGVSVPQAVIDYVKNVEKASSDFTKRAERDRVLSEILKDHF